MSSILDICDITESSQKSLFKEAEWDYLVIYYTKKYAIDLSSVYDIVISSWKIVVTSKQLETLTLDFDIYTKFTRSI